MGAYGFNDDKSRHPIYDAPHAITEKYTYNSATETQSNFLKRIFADILPFCRKYGANIKLRLTNNNGYEYYIPMSHGYFDAEDESLNEAEFIGMFQSNASTTSSYYALTINSFRFLFKKSGTNIAEVDGVQFKTSNTSSMVVGETKLLTNTSQGEFPNLNQYKIDFVI